MYKSNKSQLAEKRYSVMCDGKVKTKQHVGSSANDEFENIVNKIIKGHRHHRWLSLLEKSKYEYAVAEASTELTKEEIEDMEEARETDRLIQQCDSLKKLLKNIVRRGGADTELGKKATEGLVLLNKIEAGNTNLSEELGIVLFTVKELCRAEDKKQKNIAMKFIKSFPRIIIFLAALLTCIGYILSLLWHFFTQ